MMEFWGLYKHINNTDVAMMVHDVDYYLDTLEVKCYWFNITNKNKVFQMDSQLDIVRIQRKDLNKWTLLTIDYDGLTLKIKS